MKGLNNRIYILSIVLSIILISIFSYYSFFNMKKNKVESSLYKTQNKILKDEIKENEESINFFKSKLDVIEDRESRTMEMENYYKNVNFNLNTYTNIYNKGFLKSLSGNLDIGRKNSLVEQNMEFEKLNSTYFLEEEVFSRDEAMNNIIVNSLVLNDYLYEVLNSKIVLNNNEMFKKIGVVDQIENNNNYIVKDKLYKILLKDNEFNNKNLIYEKSKNILKLKEESILAYDNLLYPSDYNYNYLNEAKNNLKIEKDNINYNNTFKINDSTLQNIKKINKQSLFNIDVISQNINYLKDLNIIKTPMDSEEEQDNKNIIRYLVDSRNRIYLIEENLADDVFLNYYNSEGNALSQIDLNNYRIHYFYDKKNSEILGKYNYSMNLYKNIREAIK